MFNDSRLGDAFKEKGVAFSPIIFMNRVCNVVAVRVSKEQPRGFIGFWKPRKLYYIAPR